MMNMSELFDHVGEVNAILDLQEQVNGGQSRISFEDADALNICLDAGNG